MKRPFGLKIVALLMCAGAGLLVLGSVTFLLWGDFAAASGGGGPTSQLFARTGAIGVGIFLTLAIAYFTLAIYTWRLAYWARSAAIVAITVGLLFAVTGIVISLPHPEMTVCGWQFFVIAVDVWILWYLTRPHIKDAFAAVRHRPGESGGDSILLIQELTKEESLEVLSRSHLGRLACARAAQPYIVPIYFAFDNNCLHSFSTLGQKIQWMRDNPLVCVQVDEVTNSRHWVSVIVFGRFEELPDTPEWRSARQFTHDLLQRKAMWWEPGYVKTILAGNERPLVPVFYRIHIAQITGHRAGTAIGS